MFDALYISATGMQAQQQNVDAVANNLANVNTPGYKKTRVSFTDLVAAGAVPQAADAAAVGDARFVGNGVGVGVAQVLKMFDAGALSQTGSPWDVAIMGNGFLQVTLPDGSTGYSRGGALKVASDGQLATQAGLPLRPGISIPANATAVSIAADGSVSASLPNQARPVQVGQLQLARFANPAALQAQGDNIYRAGDAVGELQVGPPGQDGGGVLQQGFLEGSNVKMVDEMVNLMVAQRAYEANVKVVQASDELLGLVNNLRK
jgi:flagellar basal-body rod protein FlgG